MLVFWSFINTGMIHIVITWMGSMFVKAELPRIGNEKLLNGLQEGVFIVEEETSHVLFQNSAAGHFNTKMNTNYSVTLLDENNIFDKS